MERIYDALIVGGGPAGYAAALYCVRGGLSVLLLEGAAPGGQLGATADVDNYPGFEETVAGLELAERMRRGAERFGAVTKLHQVTALDLTSRPKRAETAAGPFFGRAVI